MRRLKPQAHHRAPNEEQARNQTSVRTRGGCEPERPESVVEHDRVHDRAKRRACCDSGHRERTSCVEVLRDEGEARDVE